MNNIFEVWAGVVRNFPLAEGIYDIELSAGEIAARAVAGQFVSVYSPDSAKLLPRPISICGIDRENGRIRLVYRVTGKGTGTEDFSRLKVGDTIRVLGPLGNGFTVSDRPALLVGGGVGIPPMLALAKRIQEEYPRTEFRVVLGYRDAGTYLRSEFEELGRESFAADIGSVGTRGNVMVATEDGSVGEKGNVLDVIREMPFSAEVIYACGPKAMLRALKDYAIEKGIECQISMEERMACGIGACLACVCETPEKDSHSNVNNRRICKEGPVFEAREVNLE